MFGALGVVATTVDGVAAVAAAGLAVASAAAAGGVVVVVVVVVAVVVVVVIVVVAVVEVVVVVERGGIGGAFIFIACSCSSFFSVLGGLPTVRTLKCWHARRPEACVATQQLLLCEVFFRV